MLLLFIIGGIVGFVGGFSSFSHGHFFKRTIIGQCIPAIAFTAEMVLGVYGWYSQGFLMGLSVFLFSWAIAGWIGMKLAKSLVGYKIGVYKDPGLSAFNDFSRGKIGLEKYFDKKEEIKQSIINRLQEALEDEYLKQVVDKYGLTIEDLYENFEYLIGSCSLEDLSWEIITKPSQLERLINMRKRGKSDFGIFSAFRKYKTNLSSYSKGEDISSLWSKYLESNNEQYLNRLVEYYHPLVERIAKKIYMELPEDIPEIFLHYTVPISFGIFSLIDSIKSHKPDLHPEFETYCKRRIRIGILDDLCSADWIPSEIRAYAQRLKKTTEEFYSMKVWVPPVSNPSVGTIGVFLKPHQGPPKNLQEYDNLMLTRLSQMMTDDAAGVSYIKMELEEEDPILMIKNDSEILDLIYERWLDSPKRRDLIELFNNNQKAVDCRMPQANRRYELEEIGLAEWWENLNPYC